ncbi:MAG: penicillin-binding protein 2 [Sedimenticola sp.]|uniref:Peptidoglycan D,D-transpeptidase MrdA n=1 Tax=Sedimenticola thiotaurini TaxID=1543721 RepID=A0A558DEQ9_9GAMM|nr:penicillin-binding protein 2 [Sedimenticola sp.]MCW9022210.1 penicillin-binding protein 2 [Sedimenticola sp.]TVT59509.1 MAG: penicillin-binding protein 2 [Sedimenticola thiotaurini]
MYQSTLKDYLRESRLFRSRAIIAALIVLFLLLLLALHLAKLQIIDHTHFTTLSRDNRVRVEPLPPTRGLIYDRNGVILAQNLPTHSLEITPERVKNLEKTLEELGQLIPISENDIKRFRRLKSHQRRFESIPIRVQLTDEEVARFAVNRHLFPGVDIHAKLLRDYPKKDVTAHILGYVGRINKKELQIIDNSSYSGTTHIGKNGVEKYYEEALHGEVGLQQVEVNALGRVIRVLENTPPVPGMDLHLTLDSALQEVALRAFGEDNGAAVAINPENGDILAMVSKPGFDPNLFVEGISSADYHALQTSEDNPLFNRAIRGQYPPGSTIKPFIGLAGLESGVISATQKKFCPGFFQLPNHSHKYRDWKKTGHGSVDLYDAITQSCDVYYYDLALQMGIDKLTEYLAPFGFGEKTGVDITGELGGLLPSREWKKNAKKQPWYPGETLITGIGQGYFLTTPLQLASATATLSSRGKRLQPRIVKAIQRKGDASPIEQPIIPHERVSIQSEANWDTMRDAMLQVTEGLRGTARNIRNENYHIAGKTGTAQVFTIKQEEKYDEDKIDKKMRDHALFMAFAPAEKPKIAVAIIIENGGHGGSVAAPIAKAIMDYYLLQDKH